MNVIVVSDTHLPTRTRALPRALLADLEQADLIIHAGDFATFDVFNDFCRFAPMHAVHGNVDDMELQRILPRRSLFKVFGRPVGLIHGDGVVGSTVGLAQAAFRDDEVDIIIFGHSHQPLVMFDNETMLFNPGSPTDKRTSSRFSYGRLRLGDAGRLAAEHVWI